MLRNVYFGGPLGRKFGKKHILDISSIGELINACRANYGSEFTNYIKDKYYEIRRGEDLKSSEVFNKKEQLTMNFDKGSFYVIQKIEGAKSGWVPIFIGSVLIVAGVYFQQPWLVQAGIGMMMGGVAMLLTPIPIIGSYEEAAEKKSFIYNGPVNSVEQGRPIPLVYGRCIVGSTIIQGEMDIEQI